MSARKGRRRGNAKQRLQKQLEIQRELERELQQLNNGKDQQECAKEIVSFVQNSGSDPMLSPDNPFHVENNDCCCLIQ